VPQLGNHRVHTVGVATRTLLGAAPDAWINMVGTTCLKTIKYVDLDEYIDQLYAFVVWIVNIVFSEYNIDEIAWYKNTTQGKAWLLP